MSGHALGDILRVSGLGGIEDGELALVDVVDVVVVVVGGVRHRCTLQMFPARLVGYQIIHSAYLDNSASQNGNDSLPDGSVIPRDPSGRFVGPLCVRGI